MKVLMTAPHVGPNGGAGAHVAASGAALERAGFEVTLAVMSFDSDLRLRPEVRIVAGLGDKLASKVVHQALRDQIRELQPDLVHIQQLSDGSLISTARAEAPVVFNVHNFVVCTSGWKYFRRPGHECHRPHGPGCVPNLLARGCGHTRDPRDLPERYSRTTRMVKSLRTVDTVVAHSNYVVNQLRLNSIERTSLVPLFVASQPEVSPIPRRRRILFSGRVTTGKGLDTLLHAAAGLEAEIQVCGDGWWLPRARKLARRLGIEDAVEFSGWCTPEDLARAYRSATVVAVPSHWPEPFGLVGIEAMAHGRPVVASAGGGIPEWLADGESGLLVAPGDVRALSSALRELLDDPERCARMGQVGAARVKRQFSEERYLEAITKAYSAARKQWRSAVRPGC